MDILIENEKVSLSKYTVIGTGGESIIHENPINPDKAIKIYKDPKERKIEKLKVFLRKFNFIRSRNVIAPIQMISTINNRKIVGFEMRKLDSKYKKINILFKSKTFREDFGFTTKVKANMFLQIFDDVESLHSLELILGDFNSGNIMVNEQSHIATFIDVDSFQFDNYPCGVATTLYCPPELYGLNLEDTCLYTKSHDWYSYTILLIQTLLNGVHPFKSGSHRIYSSMLDRAKNKITVFNSDVTYPKTGLPIDFLTDNLIDVLESILIREELNTFPVNVLKEYVDNLTKCNSCGIEFPITRKKCPSCSKTIQMNNSIATKHFGFEVEEIVRDIGRILYTKLNKDEIICISEKENQIIISNNKGDIFNTQLTYPPGGKFGLFNNTFVLCSDSSSEDTILFVIEIDSYRKKKPLTRISTNKFSGYPIFDSSNTYLYNMVGGYLCQQEKYNNNLLSTQVMQIFENQTWFKVYENPNSKIEIISGFHRDFSKLDWFVLVFTEYQKYIQYNLDLEPLDGKESLLDIEVYFEERNILFVRKTKKKGYEYVRFDIFNIETKKINYSNKINIYGLWDNIHNKIFNKKIVIHPTDKGLVSENLVTGKTNTMFMTERYVSSLDKLKYLDTNHVFVVKEDKILKLKMN